VKSVMRLGRKNTQRMQLPEGNKAWARSCSARQSRGVASELGRHSSRGMFNWSVDVIVWAVDSSKCVRILVLNAEPLGHREQRGSPSLTLSTALPIPNFATF